MQSNGGGEGRQSKGKNKKKGQGAKQATTDESGENSPNLGICWKCQVPLSLTSSSPTSAFIVEASSDWTADTGASSHMTPHCHWFSSYRPLQVPVCLADGRLSSLLEWEQYISNLKEIIYASSSS